MTLRRNGWTRCFGECSPEEKTDNLVMRSIKALFEGKVRLPLTEVRKGLRSSSIWWRGSPELRRQIVSGRALWPGSSGAREVQQRRWRFLTVRKKAEKEKKKKKQRVAIFEKMREKKKKKKGKVRKYGCLMNEKGIVIVKFEVLLFIILTFLLK